MPDKNTAEEFMRKYLERGAEKDFKPYVHLTMECLNRGMKLVQASEEADGETASEILRAVVVLNHAYFEDFMRALALAFLPTADEKALDNVPLAGVEHTGRAEKFFLGKLARHRGKTINDVISESVSAHMERSTFNSVSEIMSFLRSIGLKLPDGTDTSPNSLPELPVTDKILSMLDGMMQRRHEIVHRADRAKTGEGLQPIRPVDVLGWLVATMTFTLSAAQTAFLKRHSFEEFEKMVNAMRAAYEKAGGSLGTQPNKAGKKRGTK
ncbi:MAG TPA: hypothetical protein VN176_13245 [Verrucomicrobiae bacterium]|jgi:hypothetical protein|nr:hypothetical protein [Verrucomicrobiae bacterium]